MIRYLRKLTDAMSGRKFKRDLARFERAAGELDAAVREVLQR